MLWAIITKTKQTISIALSAALVRKGARMVLSGGRHPELRPTLHIKDYESPYCLVDKIVVPLTFFFPAVVDWLAVGVRKSLDLLESLGMWETWR
ncbi:hypothetical protein QUA41_22435 [Microcoleus sp. Pol11C1]|uniref:hypothetical protein n=1 Tax=unclassified Microcoleus TaxID=2642155 RepID=UPI002FD05414